MNTIKKNIQKGFTLIELLIVIAVLGVLATIVLVAIDPVDKLNAANDAKVQNDIGVIGSALQAYAVNHDGTYPANTGLLVPSELKSLPVPPTGYVCNSYNYNPVGPVLNCAVKSKKYTTQATPKNFWKFDGANGKTCAVNATGDSCP